MNTQYRYKVVEVEAVQLSYFNTDKTISMNYWMMEGLRTPGVAAKRDTDWMVRKPDGSIGFYSDEDFKKEFKVVTASSPAASDTSSETPADSE